MLELLSGVGGEWTLSGGGALVGFHLGHRTTRDLDMFWHGRTLLPDVRAEIEAVLRSRGLGVDVLQATPSFLRMRVTDASEVVLLKLVAEPVPIVDAAQTVALGRGSIRIDSLHEILVNKLCALLHRSEWRDVVDIAAILEQGGDLERAVADAPKKEAGFVTLNLIWLLRQLTLPAMARTSNQSEAELARVEAFRDELVRRLCALSKPSTC